MPDYFKGITALSCSQAPDLLSNVRTRWQRNPSATITPLSLGYQRFQWRGELLIAQWESLRMAPVLLITPPAVGKRGAGMVPLAFQKNLEIVLAAMADGC